MSGDTFLSEDSESKLLALWDKASALSGEARVIAIRDLMEGRGDCEFTRRQAYTVMDRLRCQFTDRDAYPAISVLVEMGVELVINHIPHLLSLDEQIRQQVLARNIDCNSRDTLGNSALHILAYTATSALDLEENWKALLRLGLNPHARNQDGETALDIARSSNFLAKAQLWVGEFESAKAGKELEGNTLSVGLRKSFSRL